MAKVKSLTLTQVLDAAGRKGGIKRKVAEVSTHALATPRSVEAVEEKKAEEKIEEKTEEKKPEEKKPKSRFRGV